MRHKLIKYAFYMQSAYFCIILQCDEEFKWIDSDYDWGCVHCLKAISGVPFIMSFWISLEINLKALIKIIKKNRF